MLSKSSIYLSIVLILSLGSCKSTKFLNEDQSLVKDVKIEIEDSKGSTKNELRRDLEYFIRQKKNKKFLGIPREYIYFKASGPEDTTKFDKWLRTVLGEEPSIYDQRLTDQTASSIESYLRYRKGYPNAKVSSDVIQKNNISKVRYNIILGKRYFINDIEYHSKDTAILTKVKSISNASVLKKGDPIDADIFEKEKSRIVNYLQNNGYIDFAANYIIINGDSTIGNYRTDLIIEIGLPIGKNKHTMFTIGEVKVFSDHYYKQDTTDLQSVVVNDIQILREQSSYIVKPEVIAETIDLRPNEIFQRDKRLNTYNRLSTLNAYRFAEIGAVKNPYDSTKINYNILLTPYESKWSSDFGFDVFNSSITRSQINSPNLNLLGFGISSQLENRNLLGGSERFLVNAEVGTQLELSNPGNLFRAFNYNLSTNLQYPLFKDPIKIIRTLNKLYLASDNVYKSFEKNASTNLLLGINSIDFRDLYSITSFNASMGYRFNDRISRNIIIDQIGVTINNNELRDSFLSQIGTNPVIINSFEDNIFTGVLFKNLNYTYNGPRNANGISTAFLLNLEFSGLEVLALNSLVNSFLISNKSWTLGGLEFSKFLRFEFDGRVNKLYKSGNVLAGRFNFGIINPLVKNQFSPYIKQFNVGGPNSLRAWAPRAIGPGAAQLPVAIGSLPYAQGDIKLEMNLEFRFPIWWIFEGALFTDVGNIWALKEYDNTPGAKFSSKFYNQLAIAGGWGLRLDFDYFNIRFDLGYRIRDPYPNEKGKNWYNFKSISDQGLGNIQVAVNYPF